MKKILNLDLSSICRNSFPPNIGGSELIIKVAASGKKKEKEKRKGPKNENFKAVYFDSKEIYKALDKVFYSLESTYLIYFLNKFKVEFENREIFCLKEEELNSLAMISLYFTLEAIRKDDFDMLNKIKNVNIEKRKEFIEENIQTLCFL